MFVHALDPKYIIDYDRKQQQLKCIEIDQESNVVNILLQITWDIARKISLLIYAASKNKKLISNSNCHATADYIAGLSNEIWNDNDIPWATEYDIHDENGNLDKWYSHLPLYKAIQKWWFPLACRIWIDYSEVSKNITPKWEDIISIWTNIHMDQSSFHDLFIRDFQCAWEPDKIINKQLEMTYKWLNPMVIAHHSFIILGIDSNWDYLCFHQEFKGWLHRISSLKDIKAFYNDGFQTFFSPINHLS